MTRRCRQNRSAALMAVPFVFTLAVACGKEPTRSGVAPDELVRVDSLVPPEGMDTSPMTDGAWIRFQELSIHPCSYAVRVRIDASGEASSVVDRAYDCTGMIVPRYQPTRRLSPAELEELRAAIEASGFWKLGPAYKNAERIHDGKFVRLEVREEGRAHAVDYRQVDDARLERVLAAILAAR